MEWQTALALSSAMAMSSTAIVIKLVADRLELESEHGKRVVGVLLFQDLAVVPLIVMIPALSAPADEMLTALLMAALKATVLITLLMTGGQRVMRWWLTLVARRKSEELFVLNLLLVTLGLAWITELAGLSLALGAFIAGMLISETEYKHQVELDIRPFHDVLLGLFFITIGMMLDWHIVVERWPLVLVLTTLPVLFKLVLVTALAKLTGAPNGVSLRTGLYLAQAGEFGFVLLTLGAQSSIIPPDLLNPVLASMVLSMLATPFIIMHSDRIVLKVVASEWLQQSLQMTTIARKSINIAIPTDFPPYGFVGTDLQPQGLDIDMANYIAGKLGVAVELVPVTSANRIPYLQTRKADLVISTLGKNPDREKVIDFTAAYSPFFQAVFGAKSLAVRSAADLAGKSIGVTRGAIEDQELTRIAPAGTEIRRFEDNNTTVSAFVSGQVQLIATGAQVAGNVMARNPQLNTEYKLLLKDSPNFIGVAKGEDKLRQRVNEIIAEARASGDLDRMAMKRLGRPAGDLPR
jgi:Kef-type K+ transport system membrane component KefB